MRSWAPAGLSMTMLPTSIRPEPALRLMVWLPAPLKVSVLDPITKVMEETTILPP